MNLEQTTNLLAYCCAIDGRESSAAAVGAWQDALGETDFPAALSAVKEHYAASAFPLKPADVTRLVKVKREERLAAVIEPVPPIDPDDTRAYTAWLSEWRKQVAAGASAAAATVIADSLATATERPAMIDPPPEFDLGDPFQRIPAMTAAEIASEGGE